MRRRIAREAAFWITVLAALTLTATLNH